MPNYTADVLRKKAITIVSQEKKQWEDASVSITDRVFFQMRNLIKQLRKNYWGVFDNPIDPTTQRKKIWIPLTETLVESVVKNIDLDTKDINFRAKNKNAIGLTQIVRMIVKNFLDKMRFGEHLDDLERRLAIDGTAVWKTITYKENGKSCVKIIPVDLLNVYIDPNAQSIAEAYRFIERGLLTESDVRSMTGWDETSEIVGSYGLSPTDAVDKYSTGVKGSKYVDVYEFWGKAPLSLITGNPEDEQTEEELHIVVSGLDNPGKERCHLVEKNTTGKRPYEEAWYTRVPGRWYGKGVAEKVMMLQLWVNTIINIRINRSYVQQLGLFKIRKGAGITPQMLSRLGSNGAIVVNDISDIEQFQMNEASTASYQDEENIWGWSQKVTSAFDISMGDALPASTPATNAAIQNQNAQSMFVLIKEGLGMFLQRWVNNQSMPAIFENISVGEIVSITGNDAELIRELDAKLVFEEALKQIEKANQTNTFLDPEQVQMEIDRAMAKLKAMGNTRFIELVHELNPSEYDTEVYITNEEFDKGVMSQNLISLLQTLPALTQVGLDTSEVTVTIVREAMDLMGLDSTGIKIPSQQVAPQNGNNQQMQAAPFTRPGANSPSASPAPTTASVIGPAKTLEPR